MTQHRGAYDPWDSPRRHKCLDCPAMIPTGRKRCYVCQDIAYQNRGNRRKAERNRRDRARRTEDTES